MVGSESAGQPSRLGGVRDGARHGRFARAERAMSHDERKRAEMRSMGFTDDMMIDRALTRARGNVESAVEMLFEGVIPPNGTAAFEPGRGGPVVRRNPSRTPTKTSIQPTDAMPGPSRLAIAPAPARPQSVFYRSPLPPVLKRVSFCAVRRPPLRLPVIPSPRFGLAITVRR